MNEYENLHFFLFKIGTIAHYVKFEPNLDVFRVKEGRYPHQIIFNVLNPTNIVNEDQQIKVTFSKDIESITGQKFEKDIVWIFTLTPPPFPCAISSYVQSARAEMLVHDPFVAQHNKKSPMFVLRTYNYRELRVCLYRMNPMGGDLKKWKAEFPKGVSRFAKEKSDQIDYFGFGQKLYDAVVPVDRFVVDNEIDFFVDLSPALQNGVGQVGIVVVPTQKAHYPNRWEDRKVVRAWVQCTKLGVEVVQSYDNFHVWVSDILTGKPRTGVRCSIFRPFDNFKDTLRRNITRLPSSPLITSGGMFEKRKID